MEILQSRAISHNYLPKSIQNPYDFVTNQNEAFKIKDIRVTEVKSEQDLLRVTSQDKPDIHTQDYTLQLQYHINGTRGHFLLVSDEGQVMTNGHSKDPRTLLTIIHNFTRQHESCYQIIGWGTNFNQTILYMDGTALKTRPFNPCKGDNNDDTFFAFRTKGNSADGHYSIVSWTGHPLVFDTQGNYLPPNNLSRRTDTSYLFKLQTVDWMKVTTV
ncbi:uncharacterized protein LOC125682213 [Ostrea edulis]|uniref:uncharacterized protein LOC125682213 n=1 Tax=Ostrea edulis TaxID=37623 RepID=UPI002094FE19|nr:uncharacterized protein LOC125682213 [Ostrea edulis]